MKKILLILALFCLAGCSDVIAEPVQTTMPTISASVVETENDATVRKSVILGRTEIEGVYITEVDYYGDELAALRELNLEEETVEPIHTNQQAIETSRVIIEKLQNTGYYPSYVLLGISHYAEENVWKFCYGEAEWKGADIICEPLYVIIDGNNGEYLYMW